MKRCMAFFFLAVSAMAQSRPLADPRLKNRVEWTEKHVPSLIAKKVHVKFDNDFLGVPTCKTRFVNGDDGDQPQWKVSTNNLQDGLTFTLPQRRAVAVTCIGFRHPTMEQLYQVYGPKKLPGSVKF